jgi:hypothetical protein
MFDPSYFTLIHQATKDTPAIFGYAPCYYSSSETLGEVQAPGYFNPVAVELKIGDGLDVCTKYGSEDYTVSAVDPDVIIRRSDYKFG